MKLIETTYRARLQAKQEVIEIYRQENTEMKAIIHTLAERPLHVHTTATSHSGDRSIEVQGDVREAVINQGELDGGNRITSSRQNNEVQKP